MGTRREFDPEKLPRPDLDGPASSRLRGLPFWEEAIATEVETRVKISAYAARVRGPLLREAVALQGGEELRHEGLLSTLLTRYDVRISERQPAQLPVDLGEGAHASSGDQGLTLLRPRAAPAARRVSTLQRCRVCREWLEPYHGGFNAENVSPNLPA